MSSSRHAAGGTAGGSGMDMDVPPPHQALASKGNPPRHGLLYSATCRPCPMPYSRRGNTYTVVTRSAAPTPSSVPVARVCSTNSRHSYQPPPPLPPGNEIYQSMFTISDYFISNLIAFLLICIYLYLLQRCVVSSVFARPRSSGEGFLDRSCG